MILSTVTTAGTPSQIGQRLAFWCKLPAIPYQNTTRAFFALAELHAEHWEHLWSQDAIPQLPCLDLPLSDNHPSF
jgi:hypothetical protein